MKKFLQILSLAALLCVPWATTAQTYLSEDFSTTPNGWTGGTSQASAVFSGGTLITASSPSWDRATNVRGGLPAGHYYFNIYTTSQYKWIITPSIDLSNAPSAQLSFDLALTAYNNASAPSNIGTDKMFMVIVSTDGGTTWSPVAQWLSSNGDYLFSSIPTTYMNYIVDLNQYIGGSIMLAFYTESSASDGGDMDIHLDNVVVEAVPTCIKVSNVYVDNITTTGATIHWTDGNNAQGTTYSILYQGDDYATSNTTSYTLSGLTPQETVSDLTIVANCPGNDGQSAAVAVPEFTTLCGAISQFPWSEDFNSYSGSAVSTSVSAPTGYPNHTMPDCWSFLNMSIATSEYPQAFLTSYNGYNVDGNSLFFKSSSTTPIYAILPATSVNLSGLQLQLSYRNEGVSTSNGTVSVGYMTDINDASTYVNVESFEQINTLTQKTVMFIGAPAGARAVIRYQGGTSNNYYASVDNVTLSELPSCLGVTGVAVSGATASSITLTWTDNNNGQSTYSVYCPDTKQTYGPTAAGATTITIPGLASNTEYTFIVTADCGNNGESTPVNVTGRTACGAIETLPFAEGFENVPSGSYQMPFCWTRLNDATGSSNYYPYSNNYNYRTGSRALYFYAYTGADYADTMLAILPQINTQVLSIGQMQLTLYARLSSAGSLDMQVGTMSDPENAATFTAMTTFTVTSTTYSEFFTYLSETTDQYIAIMVKKPTTSASIYVDDLLLEAAPACKPVTNLAFGDVTRTSFTASWNHSVANLNNFQVVLSENRLDVENISANPIAVTGRTKTFTDLNRNTKYYVYVRANCGNDGYSTWVEDSVTTHGLSFCENIVVASGSTTNNYVPFEGYNIDSYTQHSQSIYPASMLTELVGKSIMSMTFRSNVASKDYGTTSTFKIGVTGASDVSSDFASTDGLTTVYTGSLAMSGNRMTITFSEPFTYNGGNLLVDFQSATTGSYLATGFYGISSTGASRYQGNGSATAYAFLPELTVQYCESVEACPAVTNVTVSNIDVNSATVTWEASTGDYVEGYYIDTVSSYDPQNDWYNWPLENMAYVPAGTTTYNLTGLNGFHNYYVVITTKCGNQDGNSSQAYAQFRTASECRVPENIASTITGKQTATVSWEAGSNSQTQDYQYFVMYGQAPDADYYNSGYGEPDVINNAGSATSVDLTNLPTGTYVYFFLRNNCGQDGYSPWVMHTFETYPLLPAVVNLQATQVSHSAIGVTWERNTAQFADETQWMVGICIANSCTTNYSYVTSMDTVFVGLQPETEYQVVVIPVIDGNGNHQEGEPTRLNVTTEAIPSFCAIVADGTTINNYVPVYGNWADAYLKAHFVYPANDLSSLAGKELSQMTFFLSSSASAAWTGTFNVYVAEVNDATISSFADVSNMTNVYTGTLDATGSTMVIPFSTNYTYNGGNLLVAVEQSVKGNYKSASFYGITSNNSSVQGYSSSALESVTPTQQNFLPKVQFCYEQDPNACWDVTNVSITNITANSVDISWLPGNMETGWRYMISNTEYNPAAQGVGAGNPINVTHLSLSQLTVDFDYLFWICPVDGQGIECGNWVSFPFSTLPTCSLPTLQPATNVTTTSATISAVANGQYGTPSTYTFRYWISGEEFHKTTVPASANNTANLTNLTPNTTYYYEAMVSCTGNDGDSRWTEPMSFTTEYQNITLPYSTSFSTSYIDDQHWRLVNGTHDNKWAIGSATDATGNGRALYVSNDGGTSNAYNNNGSCAIFAYAGFSNFEADKQYTVEFDWKAYGESSWDYLRAWIVPDAVTFTAGTSTPNGVGNNSQPDTWIPVDGGSNLMVQSTWQHQTAYVTVPADGAYKLVFMWYNDNSTGSNPPAAIDNVSIQESQQYTATAQVRPEGVGIGAVTGGGTFYEGTDILFELAAETPHGYGFLEWRDVYGNRITGESVLAHRVVADTMFLAIYDSNTYTITAVTANQAHGTAAVNGESTVKFNKPVTIVATPAPCYQFLNWTNEQGQVVSTDAEYTVNAYDSYTFTANFELSTITGDTTAVECDQFTWHDNTYYNTPAQAPIFVYTTNDGCDSTVTLKLTINHSTDSTLVVVACESYVMNLDTHEETYTETPDKMPVFIFQNAAGCDSTVTLNLTINTPVHQSYVETVCDSYTWNNTEYTQSGDYQYSHVDNNGCTQVDTLHLTVNYSTGNTETVTICNGYVWQGQEVTESGTYTATSTNDAGCTHIDTLLLTVNKPVHQAFTETACESYTWNRTEYTQSGDYTYTHADANNCNQTDTLHLTINTPVHQSYFETVCDSYTWNNTEYTQSGDYQYSHVDNNNCTQVDTLHLTINNAVPETIIETVCDSYTWNNTEYTQSGDYTYSHTDNNGCTQVDTLHLTVNYSTGNTETVTICNGYVWQGEEVTESGTYTATSTNDAGCTHIDTLVLTVNKPVHQAFTETACESYTWNSTEYTQSGDYTYSHVDNNNCTQVDTLHLTINNAVPETIIETVCDSYTWNNTEYTQSGDYTYSHIDNNGCTQVDTLHLTINNSTEHADTVTICNGYVWQGEEVTESGVYTATSTNDFGCTHTETLVLTVNKPQHESFTETACESYTWNSTEYTQSGDYTYTHADANNCTQVDTLHLTINTPVHQSYFETVCDSYTWNNTEYTQSGDYTYSHTDNNGCTQVDTLHLTVNYSTEHADTVTICNGYVWQGEEVTESGVYTATSTNDFGCTHTETLVLTVNKPQHESFTETACESYTWNNTEYTQSGDYTYSHVDNNNCTQVDTLHLTINNAVPETIIETVCDSYTWNNTEYTQSGDYTYSHTDNNGCTQVDTLHLTVNYHSENTVVENIVENDLPHTFNGQVFNGDVATDIVLAGENAMGCDSVIHYTLNVEWNSTNTVDSTICASELPFTWNNVIFTMAGTQSATLTTLTGADSNVVMILNVYPQTGSDTAVTACNNFTWYDVAYGESDTLTHTLTDVNGCDSIITLYLTINNSTESVDTVTVCDSYEWHGVVYTESAVLEFDTVNAAGCNHHETLVLTVNNSTEHADTVTICNGYVWQGEEVTESGVYTATSTNDFGCTHTEILVLTVNVPQHQSFTYMACDSYSWNDSVYTENGDYTYSHVDNNNCTQVDTLHLTINNAVPETIIETVCDSYTWNNTEYTQSGDYTYSHIDNNGCTQVDTLHLTINNSTEHADTVTICNGYVWQGEEVTESGTYTATSTNDFGCTHTEILVLTVNMPQHQSFTVASCDSYNWNDSVYTESGDYTYSHTDSNNCTQVDTLHLTINNSAIDSTEAVACDSYEWNNSVYTESGRYTMTTENDFGCTHTSILNLTVNQSVSVAIDTTVEGSYVWNDTVLTESGVYMMTFTAANGCDSTVTLTLTVIALPTYATVPYSTGFEEGDDNAWEFVNGTQPNYWMIGNATSNGGSQSMYITNDGSSNAYTVSSATSIVFATRTFNLTEAGEYAYRFDWKASGESSYDFIRAAMVPENTTLTAGNYGGFNNTAAVPTGGIAIDGSARLNLQSAWQSRAGTFTIDEPGLYTMVFLWRNDNSGGAQPPAAIDNISLIRNTCPMVQNIVATATSSTIEVSWTVGGNETSWEVSCGGSTVVVNTTTYTFSGLEANTDYTVGVRAICSEGDTSISAGVSVRTACGLIAELPWTEDFENVPAGNNQMPYCWTRYTSASSYSASYPYTPSNTTNAYSGTHYLYMYTSTSQSYPDTVMAITPELDVTTYPMNANRVAFYTRMNSTTYSKYLYIGTLSDPTDMGTLTVLDSVYVTGDAYERHTVSLAQAPATDAYVALIAKKDNYGAIYLDDFTLEEMPSCLEVADLTVTGSTASSITVSWADNTNSSATYTIYNDTAVVATGVTGTTYTVTGLEPVTQYTIGVQAVCASGNSPVMTVTGRTQCAPMALPYTTSFENDELQGTSNEEALPWCWTRLFSAVTGSYNYFPYSITTSTSAMSGSKALYFSHHANTHADTQIAVLPQVDVTTFPMNGNRVVFWAKMSNATYSNTVHVGTMSDPTDMNTFTEAGSVDVVSSVYERYTISLANMPAANQYVALMVNRNTSLATTIYTYTYIDDLTIEQLPACVEIADLTAGNATSNSITLSWSDYTNSGATYSVYNGETLVASGITGTTYTVTGLTANTEYTFSVVANCSADAESEAMSVSARTECDLLTSLPYIYGFEDAATGTANNPVFDAGCWHRLNNGTTYMGYPYISSSSSYCHTGSRGLCWYNAITTGTYGDYQVVVLPGVGGDYSIDGLRLKFWAKASSANYRPVFTVGVMTDPTDIATFETVATVNVNTEGNTDWAEYTANLNSYAGNGRYVALRADRPASTWYAYVDDFTLEELPSCVEVTDLAVADATDSSITLAWTDDINTNATYNVYNGEVLLASNVAGTTYTVSGLTANTEYTFSVAVNCSATETTEAVSVTGRTECSAFDVPYTWTFEDYTTNATPNCWMKPGSGNAWVLSDINNAYNSTNYLRFNGSASNLVLLPVINGSIDTLQLRFWTRPESITSSSCGTFSVGYMTNATDETSFVEVANYRYNDWTAAAYEEKTVTFAGAPAGARIAMRHNAGNTSWYWYVDDVTVEAAPSCLPINNIAVSNVTETGATLTWNGAATAYSVYNMADGSLVQTVSDATVTLSGLTANTNYTIGVAAVCGESESDTVTVTFRTACAAIATLPYSVGFEAEEIVGTVNTDAMPYCWTRYNTLTSGYNYYPYSYNYANYAHNGSRALYFYNYTSSYYTYADTTGFILPALDVTTYPMNANRVTFWARVSGSSNSYQLQVGTMTDPTDISTFTLVDTMTVNITDYTKYTVSLAGASATDAYVAVLVPKATANGTMYLDDLTLEVQPTCADVAGLTLDSQTASSASVSWNANGADSYEVEVRQNGVAISNVSVAVSDTTAEISDLQIDNDYQVVVRAVCGTTPGAWSDVLNIHIGYCLPNPTSRDGQGITSVAFGGMTNSTTHPTAAPFYGNYSDMSGTVAAGTEATVDITYATGFTYGTVIWVDWNNSLSFDGDEVVYTGQSTNANPTTLTATFNIPANTDTGSYRMRIAGADNHFDNYINNGTGSADPCFSSTYAVAEDYTIVVTEAPSCLTPLALTATAVTATTATLTWDGNAGSYNIYNMADTSLVDSTSATSYELTGLSATTQYTFGVAANCGDSGESDYAVVTFNTACGAVDLPFTETFETTSASANCWTSDGPGSWTIATGDYQATTGAYEGSLNAKIQYSARNNVTKFISPAVNTNGTDSVKLTYAHIQRAWSSDQDQMRVYYRTVADGEWTVAAAYTSEVATWTVDSVVLPANTYQVAFEMTDNWGYGVAIDSIVFGYAPADSVPVVDTTWYTVNVGYDATMGTVTGAGMYEEGATATLTATAASCYTFTGWSNGDTAATITLTVDTNISLAANFVANVYSGTDTVEACNSYIWHGTEYFASTDTATYTATTANGCDSVVTLHLTVNNSTFGVETLTACDSITWNGTLYTESNNTDTIMLTNVAGCDSTVTLNLTINYGTHNSIDTVACDSFVWNDSLFTESGIYTFAYSNDNQCASVDTLHLTVNNSTESADTVTVCGSYLWHGVEYTESGEYEFDTVNASGCTHHETLSLTVNNSTYAVETLTACDSLVWNGTLYTQSNNTDTMVLTNQYGCDSIVTLNLTVNYSNTSVDTITACNSYIWHGTEYFASNDTATYTTTNATGCDSVVTLNLTINQCNTTELTACDSYTWSVNDMTYTQSGTYIEGTDTLVLTINYSTTGIDLQEACDMYTWIDDSIYTESTTSATYTLDNAAGCDSVVTLNLTIHSSNTVVETLTACDSYLWNGTLYTESNNTDTMVLTNQYGCDSIVTLNLTVNYSSTSVDTITACNSYIWHGTEYFASNDTATYTTTNAAGCDSVITLNLTINQCNTTTITACDTYTWNVSGQTYTVSDTYIFGNDTLVLTINHSTTAIDLLQACDSYAWIDGNVYTENNSTATYTLENAAGCDSVVTLNLTVNYTVTNTVDVTAAPGYTIGNNIFNESTVFVDTLEAATGCDSIVTYNITIVSQPDDITFILTVNDTLKGTTNPLPGTYTYSVGDSAMVEAIANDGYRFDYWLVSAMGMTDTLRLPMYAAVLPAELAGLTIEVQAVFVANTYHIVGVPNDTAMGSVYGSGWYNQGSPATLSAVAKTGYRFVQWSNGETTPTLQFIATEDVFVTAIFDTIEVGIEDAEEIDITVYSTGMRIIVKGAEGHDVRLFDVNGRLINVATKVGETTEFRVNATGVYLIKVDNYPAKRVLVVR